MISKKMHVFPFGKVRPGSAIVIYGAGAVGHGYYLQIKATNYCRPLFIVDKMGESLEGVEVRSPDALLETEYDHVVIAVQSKRTEAQIADRLMQMGVPAEKVVCNNRAIIGDGEFWDRDDPAFCAGADDDEFWITIRNSWFDRVPQSAWNRPAPASYSGENFYFDIAKAKKLYPGVRGIAVIFFCGIGDYLYGTPVFEELKKKFPDLELYGCVSENTDNNNSPQVLDLLETNPHFEKVFYYDGKPNPQLWKNYDYSDALKYIPDDFLIVPFTYKCSSDSEHRVIEIFDMFCLDRPMVAPRPVLYPQKQARPHVTELVGRVARLAADSRGVCIVQFEHRSSCYKYYYINELIDKLLFENYVVIPTSQELTISHPKLVKLDFSVFKITDSLELFRLLAKGPSDMYFIGCNSMSWALSGALNIPNLSVQHIADENNFSLWFPNIMVVTPIPYSRIPVHNQYVDKRATISNGESWNGRNIECFDYHPGILWEHFRRLLGRETETPKRISVLPEYARRHADEAEGEGLRSQRKLVSTLGFADYFAYAKKTIGTSYKFYGVWQDEYGKMINAALDLYKKNVLDMGCAAGAIPFSFSKQGANAHGCDVNGEAIRTSPFPIRDKLFILETSTMSDAFPTNSFDIIHSGQVFEHLPGKEYTRKVIRCLYDIARESAFLFLAFPVGKHLTREELLSQTDQDITHINIWPREWWKSEFERAGFIEITKHFLPIIGCYQYRESDGRLFSFYKEHKWDLFFLAKKKDGAFEAMARRRLRALLTKQASFSDKAIYREFIDDNEICPWEQRKIIEMYL